MKIKSVLIVCRERCDERWDIYYAVGSNGVTRIEKFQRCGEMSYIDIYNIYEGDFLKATIERPNEIIYEKE